MQFDKLHRNSPLRYADFFFSHAHPCVFPSSFFGAIGLEYMIYCTLEIGMAWRSPRGTNRAVLPRAHLLPAFRLVVQTCDLPGSTMDLIKAASFHYPHTPTSNARTKRYMPKPTFPLSQTTVRPSVGTSTIILIREQWRSCYAHHSAAGNKREYSARGQLRLGSVCSPSLLGNDHVYDNRL